MKRRIRAERAWNEARSAFRESAFLAGKTERSFAKRAAKRARRRLAVVEVLEAAL